MHTNAACFDFATDKLFLWNMCPNGIIRQCFCVQRRKCAATFYSDNESEAFDIAAETLFR